MDCAMAIQGSIILLGVVFRSCSEGVQGLLVFTGMVLYRLEGFSVPVYGAYMVDGGVSGWWFTLSPTLRPT